jgi:hypothetical protein
MRILCVAAFVTVLFAVAERRALGQGRGSTASAPAKTSAPIDIRGYWVAFVREDRYQMRSTILTSQLPVSRWHEQIGDPTLADGILDRLVHNAHRIEMRGDSMRKSRGKANG